jgi:hypothetical protein
MKHKTLYKNLHTFAPKFYGEKTMGQIMYWARRMLSPYQVKLNRVIDKQNISLSGFTIGGFYDPTLQFGDRDIEMYIVFNESDRDTTFFFDEGLTKLLIDELFITLVHEKRHRYQFKKRLNEFGRQYRTKVQDEELKSEMEYYGDEDEIDAYAQEAAIEERLNKDTPMSTREKYRELFLTNDPKVYHKFLKKYQKYSEKISL